jgi:hypothetical protein
VLLLLLTHSVDDTHCSEDVTPLFPFLVLIILMVNTCSLIVNSHLMFFPDDSVMPCVRLIQGRGGAFDFNIFKKVRMGVQSNNKHESERFNRPSHLPAADLFSEASATIFLNIKRGSMRMML